MVTCAATTRTRTAAAIRAVRRGRVAVIVQSAMSAGRNCRGESCDPSAHPLFAATVAKTSSEMPTSGLPPSSALPASAMSAAADRMAQSRPVAEWPEWTWALNQATAPSRPTSNVG
jgi:hypothetical protein